MNRFNFLRVDKIIYDRKKTKYSHSVSLKILKVVQVALVIRVLVICGFDYSRVRKQGKTANSKGNIINLSLE